MQLQIINLNQSVAVDNSWMKLYQYIQEHPYSQMTIIFRDGKPLKADSVKEEIKFN